MLPSFPQRPHQVPGYSNPGGNDCTTFQVDTSAGYPYPQPGGFSSPLNTATGYLFQESAYHSRTFTGRTVSSQRGVEPTHSEGNTFDGGRRLEDPCVSAGALDPQQHPKKPHKQESLGNTSNDMLIRGFPSKLYKLLQDPAARGFIYWDDCGTVIIIPNHGELENANLLNRYFSHNKFDSLVRQFKNYAFRKLSRAGRAGENHQVHMYSHEKFRKGREDLLCEIKSKPKIREALIEPIRAVGGQPSALLAGQNITSPITASQPETSFGQAFSSQEDTQQLSRRFSLMSESVVALEKRNSLLENENMMLKARNAALHTENGALKETNTKLEQCLKAVTTQFNNLKMRLNQWTGLVAPYMTGDNVLGIGPKAGVSAQVRYTENVHQHAGGAIPSASYESQTPISTMQPPCDPSRATPQFFQRQPSSYPPVPSQVSLETSYMRSLEIQDTRASGSSAPHAYWGNQPYIEGVNTGLAPEHQRAVGSQARQPLADSTLRTSPTTRNLGSPNRRSGNPVAQVPRPHPGSGGAGHSFLPPDTRPNDLPSWN